jgi:hypothetical protein
LIFLIGCFPLLCLELLGNRQAPVQAAVVGENVPVAAGGDCTDQHVTGANLEALAPAFVVEPGCTLVIGSEGRLDLVELCLSLIPDSNSCRIKRRGNFFNGDQAL